MPTANNGNAANKQRMLQTKKERCTQKRNAANKKEKIMRVHSAKGTGQLQSISLPSLSF